MKRIVCCLLALLIVGGAHATSYFPTANELENLPLAYDRSDPKASAAYFRSYVAGVADSTRGSAWCPPAEVPADRIYHIVSAHMKNHPPPAELSTATLVTAALGASFPCPTK